MKKLLTLILCITIIFSFSVFSCHAEESYSVYSIDDAYAEFKTEHPDFVNSLLNQDIEESLLVSFLHDVHYYIAEINSHTPITENNFEKQALLAISNISSREKYYSIQDALLTLYPDAIKLAVKEGVVAEELQPIVDTVKKIIFTNGMLNLTDSPTYTPAFTFTDLPVSHWAYYPINILADNFILNGYLDGTFKPEANITRGEFAKIIVSATDSLDASANASFTDVTTDDWYYYYVASAYQKGYIKGYEDGTFRPNANITRADICTIVYRALGSPASVSGEEFSDDKLIASYAKIPVYALVKMEIINGMGDGTFAPAAFATRAQTAKIIHSAFFK